MRMARWELGVGVMSTTYTNQTTASHKPVVISIKSQQGDFGPIQVIVIEVPSSDGHTRYRGYFMPEPSVDFILANTTLQGWTRIDG
jgi:hypothetical protein